MAYGRNILLYGIFIISLSLLVDCNENLSKSPINVSIPKLKSDNRDNNYDKKSSVESSFIGINSTYNSTIATESEKNEMFRSVLTTEKPAEWFGGVIRNPSESELSATKSSSKETESPFRDLSMEFLKNSSQDVLSCTCVPYYLCDSKDILDPQQFQNDTPKVRLEMENCSNMSAFDVCCLGQTVKESFGNRSMRQEIGHSNSDSTFTTESDVWTTEMVSTTTDVESATAFDDFLTELLRNSSQQDVVLACTCAPYYRCDPNNVIVPQLKNDAVFPKVRVEMENCSIEMSEVCCLKNATNIVDSKTSVEEADRCGIRNVGGIGNQSSAVDSYSDYGEFPWVAAILLLKSDNRYRYHCSGSLIDRNIILTSAHCIAGRKESEIKIRVGEWDTRNSDEFFPHQDHFVKKIIIHEEFNRKNLHNDIAILVLEQPLNYNIHIGRICLPQSNAKNNQFPAKNTTCFSTGWGKHSFDSESLYHVVPKKASLELIEHNECQELLRQTRLSKHFNLHASFICAQDNDTCSGDGGSPLMCSFDSEPGVYQLVGMVAWGLGCGALYPSVYVDVTHFRTWISDELKRAEIETILL